MKTRALERVEKAVRDASGQAYVLLSRQDALDAFMSLQPRMAVAPFWYVMGEYGSKPTMKHATREIAAGEAKRLARANPGQRFFVLQCEGYALFGGDDMTWFDDGTIPF